MPSVLLACVENLEYPLGNLGDVSLCQQSWVDKAKRRGAVHEGLNGAVSDLCIAAKMVFVSAVRAIVPTISGASITT